jgi:hypothetical protein
MDCEGISFTECLEDFSWLRFLALSQQAAQLYHWPRDPAIARSQDQHPGRTPATNAPTRRSPAPRRSIGASRVLTAAIAASLAAFPRQSRTVVSSRSRAPLLLL